MIIRNLFQEDINRQINGVIKVDQDTADVARQEVKEYVITKELKKHFIQFFDYYDEAFSTPTADIGVWISGFFGSGKSHFLKMLSYILENKEIDGKKTVEYFRDKFADDPATFMLIDKATRNQTETILFNIDIEGSINKDKTAVLKVFAKMFYNHLGFFGENLKVAKLEQFIDKQGKTEQFRRVFKEKNGDEWLEARDSFAFFEDDIVETLLGQNYIGRSGDVYNFLTDEEQDIQSEIKKTVVDTATIVEKIAHIIFGDIYTNKKFRHDKYDFSFDQMVDGVNVGAVNGGMKLKFLSVATDAIDKSEMRLMTESAGQIIAVLGDTPYYTSLEQAMKIRKYIKQRNVAQLPKSVQDIIRAEQDEATAYESEAAEALKKAIETAEFYVAGEHLSIKGGDAKSRIEQALEYLVAHVYSELSLIEQNYESDAEIMSVAQGLVPHIAGLVPNQNAAAKVEEYLEVQSRRHLPTSMADVQARYQAIPYGWREIDIAGVVAILIHDQKVTLKYAGMTVQPDDRRLADMLRKKSEVGKVQISKRIVVSETKMKRAKEFLREYFDVMDVPDDEDGLVRFIKEKFEAQLLFPDNLLRQGSVVEQLVTSIPADNFDVQSESGQIEIIGWLYQYYISEKHEEVVDPLHGKSVKKEEVPAATQLFTTDWVVRYLIDNSVGRYWIERNPQSKLKEDLQYFVMPKSGEMKYVDEKIAPEDLTVLDPCVGSGHFLIYAFDVLEKIYAEYGYSARDAAKIIVENNLFGLEIDERATQLAYFSVMMKARQYDRRFFERGVQPNIFTIAESNYLSKDVFEYIAQNDFDIKTNLQLIVDTFYDAQEYGSILQMPKIDFDLLYKRFDEIADEVHLFQHEAVNSFLPLVKIAEVMSRKYAVVATNPPYLNKYDAKLKGFIENNYKAYGGDLFSVFIYRNMLFCKANGYTSFMTPNVWMFIKTYEKLRQYILQNKQLSSLIQMAKGAFFKEATVDICAFVLCNEKRDENGLYIRLEDFKGDMEVQKQKVLEALQSNDCKYFYEATESNFSKIPGSPIAYWVVPSVVNCFETNNLLNEIVEVRNGLKTGNNETFVRLWHEVLANKLCLYAKNADEASLSQKKWFPYNKGGEYRKWYGNDYYILNCAGRKPKNIRTCSRRAED